MNSGLCVVVLYWNVAWQLLLGAVSNFTGLFQIKSIKKNFCSMDRLCIYYMMPDKFFISCQLSVLVVSLYCVKCLNVYYKNIGII